MKFRARSIHTYRDEVSVERGEEVASVTKRAVAAAVIPNPWLHHSTSDDLQNEIQRIGAPMAITLCSYLLKMLGSTDSIEAFGKGAIVGTTGELEHGAALLHTPYVGNIIRQSLAGTVYISFADAFGVPGTGLTLPLGHKTKGGTRDYFETVFVDIPDAPAADEIVVAVGAASGPRPNARIGDRTTDRNVQLSEFDSHPLVKGRMP